MEKNEEEYVILRDLGHETQVFIWEKSNNEEQMIKLLEETQKKQKTSLSLYKKVA